MIFGTVDSDGRAAVYSFELGINKGASTQYVTLVSGTAGTGTASEQVEFTVSGLQPVTAYAYRVRLQSSEQTVYGVPMTVITQGLPEVLTAPRPLPMLGLPAGISFPTTPAVQKQSTKKASKHKPSKKPRKKQRSKARGARWHPESKRQ